MTMLENFVKWMASLPEFEREHKIDMLINLFAPNPSRADFARLKAALNRKDNRIGQLEYELKHKKSNTFDDIYSRIVAVTLYKVIAQQNVELRRNNKELLRDVINRFIEIGFGFHLGTSDLRIDFTPVGSVKTYNCLMLLGGKTMYHSSLMNYISWQKFVVSRCQS